MKKLMLIFLMFVLTACSSEESFETKIDNYISENNLVVLERFSLDEEVILYQKDLEVGMIQFIEKGFEVNRNSLPIVGDDIEMLHIGDDEDTYFGVIIRNEEMFNEATSLEVSLSTSLVPVVFDLTGQYQIIMMQFVEKSLTSCAADGVKVYNGEEVIYDESLVPV